MSPLSIAARAQTVNAFINEQLTRKVNRKIKEGRNWGRSCLLALCARWRRGPKPKPADICKGTLRGGAGGRDGASQGIALLRLKLLRCGGVFKLQKNNNWAAGLPQMRRYLTCSQPAGYGAQAAIARKYLFMFGNKQRPDLRRGRYPFNGIDAESG
jgi:hypothetical protein